jgi:F-type H+-transporting ATPase subunit b
VIPDLSVLWVIALVLVLIGTLNHLLFKPLAGVLAARERAVQSARQLAEQASSEARDAMASFDARTREARAEVYRQMDEARKRALDSRAELLAAARRQAEDAIHEATARVRGEAADARERLDRDADSLATTIVERVLGRQVS